VRRVSSHATPQITVQLNYVVVKISKSYRSLLILGYVIYNICIESRDNPLITPKLPAWIHVPEKIKRKNLDLDNHARRRIHATAQQFAEDPAMHTSGRPCPAPGVLWVALHGRTLSYGRSAAPPPVHRSRRSVPLHYPRGTHDEASRRLCTRARAPVTPCRRLSRGLTCWPVAGHGGAPARTRPAVRSLW
jgi:hypothetical protein